MCSARGAGEKREGEVNRIQFRAFLLCCIVVCHPFAVYRAILPEDLHAMFYDVRERAGTRTGTGLCVVVASVLVQGQLRSTFKISAQDILLGHGALLK